MGALLWCTENTHLTKESKAEFLMGDVSSAPSACIRTCNPMCDPTVEFLLGAVSSVPSCGERRKCSPIWGTMVEFLMGIVFSMPSCGAERTSSPICETGWIPEKAVSPAPSCDSHSSWSSTRGPEAHYRMRAVSSAPSCGEQRFYSLKWRPSLNFSWELSLLDPIGVHEEQADTVGIKG